MNSRPPHSIPWIRPRQERSRRTLQRLLDATEELLEERSLDALGIRDITEAAGCAVGSFYNYFEDKDQLLRGLLLRFTDELEATVREHLGEEDWEGVGLEERVEAVVELAYRVYSERRGLIRAVDVELRRRGGDSTLYEDGSGAHAYAPWYEFLLACRDEITAEDPVLAVRFGLVSVLEVLRLHLLYPERRRQLGLGVSKRRLLEQARRSLYRSLTVRRAPGSR